MKAKDRTAIGCEGQQDGSIIRLIAGKAFLALCAHLPRCQLERSYYQSRTRHPRVPLLMIWASPDNQSAGLAKLWEADTV